MELHDRVRILKLERNAAYAAAVLAKAKLFDIANDVPGYDTIYADTVEIVAKYEAINDRIKAILLEATGRDDFDHAIHW